MLRKSISIVALALAAAASIVPRAANAQATRHEGSVLAVSADPQNFVFRLDSAGRCGEDWFIMHRTRDNFKELVAVVLTAYSSNRRMHVQIVSCEGRRNVIDHGFTFR